MCLNENTSVRLAMSICAQPVLLNQLMRTWMEGVLPEPFYPCSHTKNQFSETQLVIFNVVSLPPEEFFWTFFPKKPKWIESLQQILVKQISV